MNSSFDFYHSVINIFNNSNYFYPEGGTITITFYNPNTWEREGIFFEFPEIRVLDPDAIPTLARGQMEI